MKIEDVVFAAGFGAFYYDDQAAIRRGVRADGFVYEGMPETTGFSRIRLPARSLGIGLVLSDGAVLWGDMMSVQYAGAAGREAIFDPEQATRLLQNVLTPILIGLSPDAFRDACRCAFGGPRSTGRLPLAVEYGVSQALLRAAAHCRGATMAEVIAAEFDQPFPTRPVPLMCQSGDATEINVDKMILKRADALPHGLINTRAKFGVRGNALLEFARWVRNRVERLADSSYRPTLHFDVYGWMGIEFALDVPAMANFIARLRDEVAPLTLHVEYPADFGSRHAQLEGYVRLRELLRQKGCNARIVVDEHCNTLEDVALFARAGAADLIQIKTPDLGSLENTALAVLACKEAGVGAYVGGSCAETELSASATVHVAVAMSADLMLAKPGMGVDEALTIVGNEQARLVATLAQRASPSRSSFASERIAQRS